MQYIIVSHCYTEIENGSDEIIGNFRQFSTFNTMDHMDIKSEELLSHIIP